MYFRKLSKEVARQGLMPGLIATLCCLSPLLLIMMGLVSASTALALTAYTPYFIPAAIAVMAVSLIYALRKRRASICGGCENKQQERVRLVSFVLLSLTFAIVTYLLFFYIVLPALAPVIVNNFGGK